MATKATIYKALLNIANMDTNYYNEHNLTLALHPSETELRLMARVIAFILNANDDLAFCKGISEDDEPDLWEKDLDGSIKLWIDLYIHGKVGGNSHTGRADNWISKFTDYNAEITKADQRSIDRIREIATPLKDFGTKRSKEIKK